MQTTFFGNRKLDFAPGLTVLTGGNGAGKSTTLGALWRCIRDESDDSFDEANPNPPAWLNQISISGTYDSSDWGASLDVASGVRDGGCPAPVVFIDAAAETAKSLDLFRSDSEPSDLLEGIDPSQFDDHQLELMSYVLKRHYSDVSVYEITSFSEVDSAVPYFEVTSLGNTYPLGNMGRGELCAAHLLWRLSDLEKGSIVFLEEPESHLAAWSQRALADVLTSIIVDRDLTVIASSHSPGFFAHLPSSHVVLMTSSPVPEVRCGLPSAELARHLGLHVTPSVMLVVEDYSAALFCKAQLRRADQALLPMVTIKYASSGESGVTNIVTGLRDSGRRSQFAVLGVLDGDQKPPKHQWDGSKYGYLVGTDSPENVLRSALDNWRSGHHSEWNVTLDGGETRLKMALERLDGVEPHDWLHELGSEYDDRERVVDAVMDLVLLDHAAAADSVGLASWIRAQGDIGD